MPSVNDPSASVSVESTTALVRVQVRRMVRWLIDWYGRTPPPERVTWGGLVACGGLGLVVLMERMLRLRQRRVVPPAFTAKFVDHLHEGRLDCGQALDHCERNPSPAARVALAAVRRWGRPAGDLERAVAMAHRVETERLRRNVGTLRRVAALSALLGVLGTLFALGRALESIPPSTRPGGLGGLGAGAGRGHHAALHRPDRRDPGAGGLRRRPVAGREARRRARPPRRRDDRGHRPGRTPRGHADRRWPDRPTFPSFARIDRAPSAGRKAPKGPVPNARPQRCRAAPLYGTIESGGSRRARDERSCHWRCSMVHRWLKEGRFPNVNALVRM